MPNLTGTEPRRTIYGFVDRLNLPGLYRTFDFPDPSTTSPRRDQTTVAPQALFLMNHPFVIEIARSMLARPDVAVRSDPRSKVNRLFELVYGRPASEEEFMTIRRVPRGTTDRYQALAVSGPGDSDGQRICLCRLMAERPIVIPCKHGHHWTDEHRSGKRSIRDPRCTLLRLMSIDALRGFDMFWIVGGDDVAQGSGEMVGHTARARRFAEQFEHVEWEGFRFYDLIFPLFLFLVGVVLPFSLRKYQTADQPKARGLRAASRDGSCCCSCWG